MNQGEVGAQRAEHDEKVHAQGDSEAQTLHEGQLGGLPERQPGKRPVEGSQPAWLDYPLG
jgi:hypothetical protein